MRLAMKAARTRSRARSGEPGPGSAESGSGAADPAGQRPPPGRTLPPVPAEPTPWATGLTASAMVAVLSTAIVVLVSHALRGAYGWLWIPANLALAVGIGPALWLMRTQPFWRWISHGVAAGFGLAWIGLAIGVVFRGRGG